MHRLARPFVGVLVVAIGVGIGIIGSPARAGDHGGPQDPGKPAGEAEASRGKLRVGQRVVTKYSVPLKGDGGVVDEGDTFRVYTVEKMEGDKITISGEGVRGRVDADDVIPLDRAVAFYTWEIHKAPKSAMAHLMRAYVHAELGDRGRALEDFNAAVKLGPREPTFLIGRGLFYQEGKEYPKAIADFTEVIRLDPKNALAFSSRADAYDDAGELEKARDDYDRAIELDPKDPANYYGRGTIWGRLEEPERSLEDHNRAVELAPKLGYLRAGRARAHETLKDYDKALADYDEAVRLDPTDVFALGARGWLLATCPDPRYRDGKKAVESARKACELTRWNEPSALAAMAAACAEAGAFDAAVKWQTKANELYRDDDEQIAYGQHRLKLYREKQPYHEDEDSVVDR
ncbi:MAG: tetratricopeptide repeat protein [Isosphaeraceae bacterium]